MSLHRSILFLMILAGTISLCCGRQITPPSLIEDLVPGFEVLAVPRGSEIFQPGVSWVPGIGPEGQPSGQINEASGVEDYKTRDGRKLATEIGASFNKLIATRLGIGMNKVRELELTGLVHRRVKSLYDTKLARYVLLETITAKTIEFKIEQSALASLNVNVAEVISTTLQDLDATINTNTAGTYEISTKERLVVAIKVAEVEYDQRTARVSLNGNASPDTLGYSIISTSIPDPLNQSVRVAINNSDLPMFETLNTELKNGQSVVNNLRKQAIGQADKRAQAADYVWDKFVLNWGAPPRITITRQYLTLKKARSGL